MSPPQVVPITRVIRSFEPLDSERIVALEPELQPTVTGSWRKHPNLFTGRALGDVAFKSEQNERAGWLTARGRVMTAGVVAGLEVDLELTKRTVGTVDVWDPARLHVAPGFGLTATGEDVMIPGALSIALSSLTVLDPAWNPDLGLPALSILVLQPHVLQRIGHGDAQDPCQEDPSNDAFDDRQRVDACKLALVPWPADWQRPANGLRMRNLAASIIFEREAQLRPGEILPWESFGLAIGVMVLTGAGDFADAYVDRYAVVRAGGRPPRRSALLPRRGTGAPFPRVGTPDLRLRQARMQQLSEHLLSLKRPARPHRPDFSLPATGLPLTSSLRHLPPTGVLPSDALALRPTVNHFFPGSYVVDAVPLPLEQLDAVLKASAALAPYDLDGSDRVRVLVPVPQAVWERELLATEVVDPAFQAAIDHFVVLRGLRLYTLDSQSGLGSELGNPLAESALRAHTWLQYNPPVDPVEDPHALEAEEEEFDGPTDAETEDQRLKAFAIATEISAVQTLIRKVLTDNNTVLTQAERDRFPEVGNGVTRLNPPRMPLGPYIDWLTKRVETADDMIDFGFLRAQSDIYRVRQHMLGNEAASRLALSPALAEIVKGESAFTVRKQTIDFFGTLKNRTFPPDWGSAPNVVAPPPPPPVLAQTVAFAPRVMNLQLRSVTALSSLTASATVQTSSGALLSAAVSEPSVLPRVTSNPGTVTDATALPGSDYVFRTTSVAQRIKDPLSVEAYTFARANKREAVRQLAATIDPVQNPTGIGVNIGSVKVPGSIPHVGDAMIINGVATTVPNPVPAGLLFALVDYANHPSYLDRIITEEYRPTNLAASDESDVYAFAIRILDDTLQMYRSCEGVLANYRLVISRLSDQRDAMLALARRADTLKATVERDLDEKRHQVATARALLADEERRVSEVNTRRDLTIAQHVRFLAYVRPRAVEATLDMPVHVIEPQLADATLSCLADHGRTPVEIQGMVEVFRESPVGWFPAIADAMRRLDRLDAVRRAIRMAKLRAITRWQLGYTPWTWEPSPGPFFDSFGSVFTAQRRVVGDYRFRAASYNLDELESLAWEDAIQLSHQHLSLGDLIDGGHGRPDLGHTAAKELEDVGGIATCLFSRMSGVLPRIRLEWATRLSEYSGPVGLRNLSALPRWHELDYRDRHDLQQHVDWLFKQVGDAPEAVGLVNDLVRVCALLASHAPVEMLVSGQVHEAASATFGGAVTIAVDPAQVRIGMSVAIYTAPDRPTVRGFVENIVSGLATARISWSADQVQMIPNGSSVRFEHPIAGYAPFKLR
jgi:hypothetical protein